MNELAAVQPPGKNERNDHHNGSFERHSARGYPAKQVGRLGRGE